MTDKKHPTNQLTDGEDLRIFFLSMLKNVAASGDIRAKSFMDGRAYLTVNFNGVNHRIFASDLQDALLEE